MKNTQFLLAACSAILSIASCKNNNENANKNVASVSSYVDSIETMKPEYGMGYWNTVDSNYLLRTMQADKDMANLEAADKIKLDSSKAKYAMLKANYEAKLKEQQIMADVKLKQTEANLKTAVDKNKMMVAEKKSEMKSDYKLILRNNLFGEGKIGTDMKFEFVNAKNILSVYQTFVNTVAANKKLYTREDWDEIKVLYEALDSRKNTVEKEGLTSKDNMKIAGLKIRFVTIKATRRFAAKIKENEDSKK